MLGYWLLTDLLVGVLGLGGRNKQTASQHATDTTIRTRADNSSLASPPDFASLGARYISHPDETSLRTRLIRTYIILYDTAIKLCNLIGQSEVV